MSARAGAMPDDWDTLAWRLELTEDLLPVVSKLNAKISVSSDMSTLGKTPSLYNGARRVVGISKWPTRVTTLAEVELWKKEPDYGIGIIARRVRAIDVDVSDADLAQAVREFIGARFKLPTRTRGNSSKFLQIFRLDGELDKRSFKTAHGLVEFLATKQQFIACGTHTSGARYEWEGGLPSEIPTLTQAEFEELWTALHTEFGVEPAITTKASTRHEVLNNAIVVDPIAQHLITQNIVLGIGADKKMNIVCPWKEQHSMDSGDTETVYYPAHTNGHAHGAFKCLHAGCEKRSQQEFLDAVGYQAPDMFEDIELPAGDSEAPKLKFIGERAFDFCGKADPEWIIRNVLPAAELVYVYGESGSGKSFFVLDMCAALVRGLPWRDHKVKKCRVSYVCAEGAGGFRKRLRAYAKANDIRLQDLDIVIFSLPPRLQDKADAVALAKGIEASGGADIVVFDTLAQCTAGTNENSGEDMGAVLSNLKGISRKLGGAMNLIVHHSGKDSSKGLRGWSGGHAAADCVIEVVRVNDHRAATVTKQKDGEDGGEFGFRLDEVVLGFDDEDNPITSCVLSHNTGGRPAKPQRKTPLKANGQRALTVFGDMNFNPATGVAMNALIAEIMKQNPDKDDVGNHKRDAGRGVDALVNRGDWEIINGFVRACA